MDSSKVDKQRDQQRSKDVSKNGKLSLDLKKERRSSDVAGSHVKVSTSNYIKKVLGQLAYAVFDIMSF